MINNIILHDHRFDIRHCAHNPQLHVGPFHNLIRFLNAVNTSHSLISLPSEFHKTGDKYDRLFFPYSVGPCVISCQMFVKSEFPLDSALVCDSDQKKLGWHFCRNLQSYQIKDGRRGVHEMYFMPYICNQLGYKH